MEIKTDQTDNYTKIAIIGRVDTVTAAQLEKAIQSVLENEPKSIIMDCTELDYISSSGLRVFLILQKKMVVKNARLSLFGLNPNIKEIFDISGFSTIFKIFPDLKKAINN